MAEPVTPRPDAPRTRRDSAREERMEILRMLEEGSVTADEAAALLDALDRADRQPPSLDAESSRATGGRARQVRIRVTDGASGRSKVNLTLPLGLVDAGLGIARRFAPDRIGDMEAIRDSIATGAFRGSLIDVDEGGERVEIILE